MTLDERLAAVRPAERQIRFQQLEFYAFVHFTVNTFTDREWGDGTEDPAVFCPTALDAAQWVRTVKAAGMKGLILTCKHHDGFCLWPSAYTEHSVAASPWKDGKGDVVREVSEECRKQGIRFGVYLSPWDRHSPLYGQGKPYDDYFVGQLTELLTNYGEIFCVWFDGACGEGPNGKRQVYDWDRYYEVIRRLQPEACINVCGPDIRWCGNEAGDTRKAEWSVVPLRMRDTEKIAADSQQSDDETFRQRKLRAQDADLGSREVLREETELIWYPAEVNTSIRPGWFFHAHENDKVKPLSELIRIYENSTGGNATFLLNLPPDRRGRIHENDEARLKELGDYLRAAFRKNLLDQAVLFAGSGDPSALRTDDYESFWMPEHIDMGEGDAFIEVRFAASADIGYLVLKENLRMGQRVERFAVDVLTENGMSTVYEGTVIGYRRIVRLDRKILAFRIRILDSRTAPALSFIGAYERVPGQPQ